MKYKVSLPEDSKRAFFRTSGKPVFHRGADPIVVDLSAEERDAFRRKGLKVESPKVEEDEPKTTAARKSRRKENE